jgi:hypothetical protein
VAGGVLGSGVCGAGGFGSVVGSEAGWVSAVVGEAGSSRDPSLRSG